MEQPKSVLSIEVGSRGLENNFSASLVLIAPSYKKFYFQKSIFWLSMLYKQKMCERNGLGTSKKALTKRGYLVFKA